MASLPKGNNMKTLDEAIKAYECCDHGEPDSRCEDCPYNGIGACCAERETDALHYLKTIETTENLYHDAVNKLSKWEDEDWKDRCLPLTWDELKQMEGKPIWMEQCNTDTKGWLLILRTNFDVINCTTRHGNSFYLYKSSYGERWQAYRKENNGR